MSRYPFDPDYQPREERIPLIYTLAVLVYGVVMGLALHYVLDWIAGVIG